MLIDDKMWSADSVRSMMMKPRKSLANVEPVVDAHSPSIMLVMMSAGLLCTCFLDVVLEDGCCSSCSS